MTQHCIWCKEKLTETNWYTSLRNNLDYKCKDCYQKKNNIGNSLSLYINGKYISRKDPLYIMFRPGSYKTLGDATFYNSKLASIEEGYVYIITNRAWPTWVKIGMAIDAEDRLNSYQTSSPYRDFVLEHSVFSFSRRESEREAHTKAETMCKNSMNEWFELSVKEAIIILDNLNEHGYTRATKEADTHTPQDNIQGSLF